MNVNEKTLQENVDPYLTQDNLNVICSKAVGKNVSVQNACILTGGCLNRVIGLELSSGLEVVLKANPNIRDAGLKHEYSVLEYFSAHTDMPVAEPLYLHDNGEFMPATFYLMSKIPGIVMHQAHVYLSGQGRRRLSAQIAAFVIELHSHKSTGFGGVELPQQKRQAWAPFWLARFDTRFNRVKDGGHVEGRLIARVAEIRPDFTKLLDVKESTLTHYDIWAGNVMVDMRGSTPQISGFLDLQGYWADYARELSFMELFGLADDGFYKIYTDVYELDDTFEIRKNLYNLKMNLAHIHMYPEQTFYRVGTENCLQAVENAISR